MSISVNMVRIGEALMCLRLGPNPHLWMGTSKSNPSCTHVKIRLSVICWLAVVAKHL